MDCTEQVYGKRKRHGHARLGAIVPKMFQTGQCSRGAEPYLTARNSGRDATISILSVPQDLLSVNKKEACKSLFLFCNSGITRLRVWIPTKQQYSQTQRKVGQVQTNS